jgi:NDP-sugar pyrophosphorylase family protein
MLLLWLRKLAAHGFRKAVINAYYMKEMIEEFAEKEKGSFPGLSVHVSRENEVLGTGGGIRNAKDHFSGPFLVANSDIYADFSLEGLIASHMANKPLFTLAAADRPEKATVSVGKDDRILGFRHPEPMPGEKERLCGAGIMVLSPEALDTFPKGPSDAILSLGEALKQGAEASVYRPEGRFVWEDMGNPQDYYRLNSLLAGGRRIVSEGASIQGESSGFLFAEEGAVAEEGSFLENCILWKSARVEKGARLRGMIVAGRVRAGTVLSGGVSS